MPNGNGYQLRIITTNPADTYQYNNLTIDIADVDSTTIYTTANSSICIGDAIALSASTNVTPTTYSWTGPSGFSSILQNPVINNAIPANGGDYYATLKFYGCEVSDTLSVTVKPLPAKPVAVNNSPLCAGDSLHLSSSSSTGGITFSWAGPGSFSSSAQDTSVANSTTAMSGDYIVTANLNGCTRKDTTTVLVKPLPAAVTLSSNGPLCAGDTLQLSSTTSTTGVSYSWTGPGSFSAATQNSNRGNATASMTGWYKMLVGLNGCTYTDSTYATVHSIPAVPNISYTNPLCVGETLNLGTATVSGASYSWSGPGNFSSSSQSPTRSNMQFGDTGMYKLATTVNGCTSDTGTATVNINPLPFVVIFANPADSICVGDRVNFTALPNNQGGTPAYQWYVNGQATGTGTIFSTTTLNHQDVVRVDMTESTKCSTPYTDPSNDITMNVLPWMAPSVSITASPNRPLKENEYATFTAIAANAGNNPLYQWKRNGQDIVGATGSVWSASTLNDNDNISVEIVSSYKCPQPPAAVSNGIVVKVLTGVAGMNNLNGLVLYPNPNNGKFVLKGEALTSYVLKIEIINAMGQVVYRDEIKVNDGKLYKEIDMPVVPAGLYMLRLSGDGVTYTTRFSVR
ncbi:MAG: T9SS type A sorting domain-containing protein [Taibaiella sp.]|nr:T9SS type A sorting domain-containing protein [Taibaiella sp.]